MARQLIYINKLGVEIKLTNSNPIVLTSFLEDGNVNIQSVKNVNQNGFTYISNTLDAAEKTIELGIIAHDEKELEECKSKINKVFNPTLGEGWLIYKDDFKELKIKGIVNKLPYFIKTSRTTNKVLINITCNNPFWYGLEEIKNKISLWKENFSFPFEFIDNVQIGEKQETLVANVLNNGDIETGIIIKFKAKATLENPSLINVNTQEFIKINKVMTPGEEIIINTEYGNKKIENIKDGIITNAINYLDFKSKFLQIQAGYNLFRNNADVGIENLECEIYFTPKYLGV